VRARLPGPNGHAALLDLRDQIRHGLELHVEFATRNGEQLMQQLL
jgi:hypothetical protein